ncbi:MAG: HAD family phosphatase [Agathobacter sp.]|nr:HAD family phosphatase [Agathobacter sp.]
MIKLIVFDLDNTLAYHGQGISKANVERLKKLENKGIKIAICSGKPVHYLSGFMRQVGLKKPYLLGENGGVLQVDVELPPKELYILPYSNQAKESLKFIKAEIDAKLPDIWYQPNMVGVSPFPKCEEEFDIIEALLHENAENLRDINIYRHVDCFDIIPVGIDKRAGVHLLAQKLNIRRDEIVAVGDSMNDYPMFAYAGLALGVNVKDEAQVNKNFGTVTEVLDYLDAKPESDDWYTLALEDMEEFIELQGIYLRQ